MQDEFEETVEIGRENEKFISWGKAWCVHIRRDRAGMGVGMIEEQTGLPVAGGRFACDFARESLGFSGMRLADSALVFYENNCVGCTERSPGDRIPNLGTWADGVIAERSQRQAAEAEARRSEDEERYRRSAERTRLGAPITAAAQKVIEAVNKLDADSSDTDAADFLRDAARLAPDSFPEAVKKMLYSDAQVLKRPVLLEALVLLDSPSDPPALHPLCVDAVADGWARAEGLLYLSEHGTADDLANDDFLRAVIAQAASYGTLFHRQLGDCTALLHYHTLDEEAVEAKLSELLRRGEAWLRDRAATASHALISSRPEAGERLVPALLDGLRHSDGADTTTEVAAEIASTASLVLMGPSLGAKVAVATIQHRWTGGSPEYRERLIDCFAKIDPTSPLDRVVEASVLQAARDLAFDALSESYDPELQPDLDDYRLKAADLLRVATKLHPPPSPSNDLHLLLTWVEHRRVLGELMTDVPPAGDPMRPFAVMASWAKVTRMVSDIGGAAVSAGHRNPGEFLRTCADIYDSSVSNEAVQAEMVGVAGGAASEYPNHINDGLPLIYKAMLGTPLAVRHAGMKAAQEILRHIPPESIPHLFAQGVATGLNDRYARVLAEATKAIQRVPVDLIDCPKAVKRLLQVARFFAKNREHDQLVQDALGAALYLVQHDPGSLRSVTKEALEIVDLMPPDSARQALRWLGSLQAENDWADVAIRALRMDDDPMYESYPHDARGELLDCISLQGLNPSQIEALASTAAEVGRSGYELSRRFADTLSELGRPSLAAEVLRSHGDEIPDTPENRWRRRSVDLVRLRFELEAAIASDDSAQRSSIAAEAKSLCDEEEFSAADSYSPETAMATGDTIGEMIDAISRGSRTKSDISALRALQTRATLVDTLDKISANQGVSADTLETVRAEYAKHSNAGPEGDVVWAFLSIVESLAFGVRWLSASWNAEADAERFAGAARLHSEAVAKQTQDVWPADLVAAAEKLARLNDQDTPAEVAAILRRVPLPPRFTSKPQKSTPMPDKGQDPPTYTAALLVRLHGEPVMRPTVLRPGAMHQLQVEARVAEWPGNADTLEVEFLSVHPKDFLYSSKLAFTPDQLQQPLEIRIAGERPSADPPLSLTALARFRGGGELLDTRLAGNTTLELATHDTKTATPPAQPEAARRLQEMMDELRYAYPDQPEEDIQDISLILAGVLRFAHDALDDRLGAQEDIDEAWFQRELRYFLRADPDIGARLEQRAGRAGGQTDLLLGKTVIELKAEKETPITLEAAESRFTAQATQYASAGDSRVSLLVVLDASPKRAPAGVMGNDMKWTYPEIASGPDPTFPSIVGTVIVRAGFPRPSDFSR